VLFRLHALRAGLGVASARAVEEGALALLAEVRAQAAAPLAAPAAGARRRRTIVEGARAILAREPGRAHPLADVARSLGISPSHLAHVFRAEAGMPLHRWLLHLRLAVALERLADGDAHLSALALDLGFATHSHFSAAFRRWCGVTPAAARATLAAGAPPAALTPHRAAS
jgi:AraC-like DNA-binding protein